MSTKITKGLAIAATAAALFTAGCGVHHATEQQTAGTYAGKQNSCNSSKCKTNSCKGSKNGCSGKNGCKSGSCSSK